MLRRAISILACLLLVSSSVAVAAPAVASAQDFADPAMEQVWNRTDRPVAEMRVARTWLWGPESFDTRQEPYEQSPGGTRLVSYFDKSRMEINNPDADRSSPWFVTNGLLARELITGRLQVGDDSFENRSPAQIPVAGDPDDTGGPTYATFTDLLDPVGERLAAVMDTIDREGNIGQNGALGNYTDYVYFVPETGHNIPRVFWDFLNSSGLVYETGDYVQGRLFAPTFFATGFPITEAYWADVKVAGEVQPVLIQAFERRVMTFTPGNPEGWQVEMGNIGRHYHTWRYQMPPEEDQTPDEDQAMDLAAMVADLEAAGATVEEKETVAQDFFSVEGRIIEVNGEDVQVFEYPDVATAESEADLVSEDGSTIGTTIVTWVATPHFYKEGRLIVLYVGDDQEVIDVLVEVLGPQFAGR